MMDGKVRCVGMDGRSVDAWMNHEPKDEWGFPCVAGRLSVCGGARAPHDEVDQQGQPNGLINKLLKVDVVEAYSPARESL